MGVPDDGRDREDGRDDDLAAFDFVIPDDLRELDDEVRAYRREQRRERLRRFLLVHRWHRAGLSAPLFVLVLLLVGFVGSMMALIGPTASPPSSRGPLARGDQTPAGQQGGLLPAVDVKVRGDVRPARDLRPAVLAIVPPGCACETLLNEVFDQAQAYRLTMYVVGRRRHRRGRDRHRGRAHRVDRRPGDHARARAQRRRDRLGAPGHPTGAAHRAPARPPAQPRGHGPGSGSGRQPVSPGPALLPPPGHPPGAARGPHLVHRGRWPGLYPVRSV